MQNETRKFDLNIESILENWEEYHAVREVISNAIDEELLSQTKKVEIYKEKNLWFMRDYGRGLKYENLTQNENPEKINHPNTIGKFGIGLKDALATFHRKGIKVTIKSKYNDISTGLTNKSGFNEIETLHAYIDPASDPRMEGTIFTFENLKDTDMKKAKELFLRYNNIELIENTKYGSVYNNDHKPGKIFINGVYVAEEENFLFSYNITDLTKKIKSALNRERTNVGRGAYSDRVVDILKQSQSELIANLLIEDLKRYSTGDMHEEVKRIDIQEHAVKILNIKGKNVFLTPEDTANNPMLVDEAKNAGFNIVYIPEKLKEKISGSKDIEGNTIIDLTGFIKKYSESFEYEFVERNDLTDHEKLILNQTDKIFNLIGGKPSEVAEIKITEKIKRDLSNFQEAVGVYERSSL